eukprot:3138835-Prymnesium_polylepis.9
MSREEDDTYKDGQQDSGLFRVLADQRDPAAECQLSTHFQWLPPERFYFVVGREECGCAAQ